MQNTKSILAEIRNSLISKIREQLEKHRYDEMDVTDCGGTPVIIASADDQDQDTFTLDRLELHDNGRITVDSSSQWDNASSDLEDLGTDTLVEVLQFLTDSEDIIWQKAEDADKTFIMDTYHAGDVCMGDLLSGIKVKDLPHADTLSVGDVLQLYCDCKHEADGDEFYRENDSCGENGERVNLVTWEKAPLEKTIYILHQAANNDGVNDSCVVNVFTDKAEAEARLKLLRDKFVECLDEGESLESLETSPGPDTLTDQPDFFCYHNFQYNHLFQLDIVEAKI